MKHYIHSDTYYLEDDEGNLLLSIKLKNNLPNNQIIVKTKKEVYAGPVDLIYFKED